MSNVCLIIGNGFDLDLGLESSFLHFADSTEFANTKTTVKGQLMRNIHYRAQRQKKKKWIDFEAELKEYAESNYRTRPQSSKTIFDRLTEYCYQKEILCYNDKDSFECLENALFEYLTRIESMHHPKKESMAYQLLTGLINLSPSFESFNIINFNYTSLPISIQENNSIHYIHGCLKNKNIIIGISDDSQILKQHSYFIKSHNRHYRSKNIREKLDMADITIFFGHSLGESDYHYFQEFFSKQSSSNGLKIEKKKIIYIITKDEISQQNILWELRKMNNNNVSRLYDLNNFEIITTKHADIKKQCDRIINNISCSQKVHISEIETVSY